MKILKNRKTAVVFSALLALVVAVSATFAWITARETKINHFENEGYIMDGSVLVVEDFEEPTDWQPGMEVKKNVYIANTGAGKVLVRVAFEEMLKILGNAGTVSTEDTGATVLGQHADYAANKLIAAKVDAASYTATNWTTLTINNGGFTVPAGVTIKKSNSGDAIIAYFEYASGLYQSVKIGNHTVNGAGTEITLKQDLAYNYFTEGTANYFSWNKKSNVGVAPWPSDYTSQPGFAATTNVSQLSSFISLAYSSDLSSTMVADKWFYSTADGYFYFLQGLESGTITPKLLDAVKMLGSAEKTFTKVDYDLAVTVEAIQATADAIGATGSSSAGWEVADSALLTMLQGLCD